jgi:uncharacterized protein YecE (DUF72 family)
MESEPSPGRLARQGIYLGTCGWTDPTLVEAGTFYPRREMTASDRLDFYASQFPIVEVDATYYAPPGERTCGLWAERSPEGFIFDVKAFRLLTQHPTPPSALWKDLRSQLPDEVAGKRNLYARDLPRPILEEAFDRFVSALLPLHSAGKLGVILFQLPPYMYPSPGAYGYLSWVGTALAEYRVAVEFRQQRWMDEAHRDSTLSFLEEHGMSYVCVDEPQGFRSSVPPVAVVTAPIAEVRFHGRNADTWEASGISAAERFKHDYTERELSEWVPRIRSLASRASQVHVLMNNCYADYGVRGARLLAGLLDTDSD